MRILALMMVVGAFFIQAPAALANDTEMTCEEINAELASLNQITTAAGDAEVNNKVAQAGTSAAVNGALYAGVGSSLPFIGGLANMATAVTSANAEAAKVNGEKAEDRMIKLQTIAEMKNCK